ncbi:membrane protein [Mycobacterium phage Mdavu]|uniref:hypothetical protein n=1 Tax=Mycobacterium phage Enkosi TaxID=1698709 RepID=UPI0006CE396B|nr:hypothetical protein AVV01_gp40 [Mycobacterium phage Enkosi]ALF01417.1 hypothetical protein ENKOSI_40 [Mycobacterium phage Enkosi]QGJ93323.1 membrane protein [Mycobacterium phage Mdavu]
MLDDLNRILRAAVLALMVCVILYRRLSWRGLVPLERGITAHLVLQAAGVWMAGQMSSATLGRALYHATGRHHLDDLLGAILYMTSCAVLARNMLHRIADDDQDAARMTWYGVTLPIVGVSIPLTVTAFLSSNVPNSCDMALLDSVQPDAALRLYWCTVFATICALAVVTILALRIIATDPVQRHVAQDWQTAQLIAIAMCAVGATHAALPTLEATWVLWWWGMLGAAAMTAYISARGWRRHMRHTRKLLRATRTSQRELSSDTVESHRLRIKRPERPTRRDEGEPTQGDDDGGVPLQSTH